MLALRFSLDSDAAGVVELNRGAEVEALNPPGRRLRRCAKYPEGRRRELGLEPVVVLAESCDEGVVAVLLCFFGEAVKVEGTFFPSPTACFFAGLGFGAPSASTVWDSAGRFLLGEAEAGFGETLRLGDVDPDGAGGTKTDGGCSRDGGGP